MKSSFSTSWPAIWLSLSKYRSPAELNKYANAGKKICWQPTWRAPTSSAARRQQHEGIGTGAASTSGLWALCRPNLTLVIKPWKDGQTDGRRPTDCATPASCSQQTDVHNNSSTSLPSSHTWTGVERNRCRSWFALLVSINLYLSTTAWGGEGTLHNCGYLRRHAACLWPLYT